MKRQREASAQLDVCLYFCQARTIAFILVKSTSDVTPPYNDQQDSLYSEGTLEASAENKQVNWQPLKRTTTDQNTEISPCTLGD